MAKVIYSGLPSDMNSDEEATKRIVDYKIEDFVGRLPSNGRIKISSVHFSFDDNDDSKNEHSHDNPKSSKAASQTKQNESDLAFFTSSKPMFSMEQVILPHSTKFQIDEALKLLEYQELIFKTWGFQTIEPNYKIALNFFGSPGTGKTMTAHAIADTLKKNIIAVDYAQIESKFVGDAPKNLDAAFRKANEDDAVLFFDEADSFLGKRIAGVSTGSEQAINSLRSQMLLAIDKFTGVVIFASNFVENYDKAFETRIRHINFELPDVPAIEKIIKVMFPEQAPLESGILYSELAEHCYGLSGRDIKNSILLAATKAAQTEKVIKHHHILESIKTIKASVEKFNKNDSSVKDRDDDLSKKVRDAINKNKSE